MKERILFVDDDPNVLEAYQRRLQHALVVRTAEGPHTGLREIMEKGPFAVVVADMNMPLMNGVQFLEEVRKLAPDTVRMMLTGNSDIKVAMQAVNEGHVFRFLTKPCPSKVMGEALIAAISQHRLIIAEKEVLEGTLKGTVELLAEILSWVNPDAFGRTVQLRNMALGIASKMRVESAWELEIAATLSQIGIMAVPQEIIATVSQGGTLTESERKVLDSVPAIGQELLARIPRLDKVAEIICYQEKHFDGGGFPDDEVAGKEIPLGGRILKAASDFQKLRAAGASREESVKKMECREGVYDPAVLNALRIQEKAPPEQAPAGRVVALYLKDLGIGLTLASPIETSEGRKLIQSGTVLTEALLIRLKKYGEANGVKEPIEVLIRT